MQAISRALKMTKIRDALIAGLLLATGLVAASAAWASTTINHQFSPATINPGDTSRYTITVANASTVPLTQAEVTVIFPSQITLVNPPNVANTCGFTGVSAVAGTNALVLTDGTIPAGNGAIDGQCTFEVDVTAIAPGNWVASIPANTTPNLTTSGYSALENSVRVWNATSANATLSVNTLQDPTGSKSFSPAPVRAGDPTTLTLTLTNPNSGATIPLTTVTDSLPAVGGAQMVVANPADPTVNCTGTGASNGTVTANPGDSSLTLTGGTIGRSGTCTVTVRVTVPALASGSTTANFTNTMASGAIGNTRGLTSPAFNRSVTVNSPITLSKSFTSSPIASGQPTRMNLVIGNASTTNTLPITSFTDSMGTAFKVLTTASTPVAAPADPIVSCTGTSASNGTLTAVDGATEVSLAGAVAGPSGNCTITVYVTSTTDGSQTNSIPAGAVTNPSGHTSPAASAALIVYAQITVSKSASPTSVAPGQWTKFSVTISNWSGSDVTATTFTDNLPSASGNQMVLDTSEPPASGCTGSFTGNDGDSSLSWNGTIPAGSGATPGVCIITFRARLPSTATNGLSFNNSLPANTSVVGTGNGPGGTVVNTNATNQNINSVHSADIAKAFSPTSIAQGGTSLLTVTIYNRTLAPLTNISLTDTLPAGLTLAPNPNASTNCNASSTPNLQAFPGDNKLILSNGSLPARPNGSQQSSCFFRANVTGATLGSYTNQINAGTMTTAEGISNGSTVTAALTIATGLSGSKSFTPTSVTSGGTSRVKITVTNTSSGPLSNVSVNDSNFSAGLSVANPANAATSCAGGPTLVANPGATSAQLLGATLNAGASCDFSFDVITAGSGPWSNTVPSGGISSAEGPANTAAVTANLTAATAQLGINKSFSPVVVTGGVPSRLTIDVINSSAVIISDVRFTDTFPIGMEIYPTPNASTNCAGGTVTAVPGSGFVTLAGATLAPTSTCQVYVDVTSVKFLNLTNTIPAGAVSSAQGYTNAAGTTASLSTLQGLGVTKAFAPAYIGPGQSARLKLRLISTYDPNAINPVILNNVSFTDSLPAGVTFATPANAVTDCAGPGGSGTATVVANTTTNALTITGATVSPATNCAVEVDVTAAATGAYNNIIPKQTVTSTEGVTNPAAANAWLYVVTAPTVSKAFAGSPRNPGVATRLTVTLTNNASVPLTGVRLADTLPAGLAIASTPNAATTCAGGSVSALAGDNEVSVSGATIPAGSACTFAVDVVGNTPGSYTNTIAAGRLISDQGLTNPDNPSATLEIRNPPGIAKVFAPASIAAGGTSTLTITLTNPNASAITLSSALVDALPGNVVVAATPNASKTCTGGTLTATASATNISYSGGTIPAAGNCTLQVDVTSNVGPASYTNLIPAGALVTSAGSNTQPASANLGVDQPAAPSLTKNFSPSTMVLGGTATLTITLGNGNATDLTLTSDLIDTLPTNVVLGSPLTLGGTCPGASTGTAGGATITYPGGALIPAGGCTVTALVTSSVAGTYTNTLAAGALVTNGGPNPLPATAGLVVQALTPPTVHKSYSLGTINPGGVTRMTLSLENANAAPLTLSADFTDTLPAQLRVATPANVGGTCTLASVTAVAGSGTVVYANGASIPSGGCTIEVDLTSSVSGGPYANTVAAGSLQTSAGNNGAPATAILFVNPAQPPSISKTFSPAIIPVGGVSTLTISFANGNLSAATLTADMVDTLPAGVTVANPPNIQASAGCSAASVTAVAGGSAVAYQAGATIPANGGCSIAVDVTAAIGSYNNTIPVGALQTSSGNNIVAATATLQAINGPGLAKSFSPAMIQPGATSTLTLTLANTNALALTLTQALADTLPSGLVVANPASVGGTCTGTVTAVAGGTSVTYANGATIPAGGCTITVQVTSATGGDYVNTLATGALQTNGGSNPTPATATLLVRLPVVIHKAMGGLTLDAGNPGGFATGEASRLPGASAPLVIRLENPNNTALTAAGLTDALPTGLVVAATPAATTTCAGGTVIAPASATSVQLTGATIPASGFCTVTVNVLSNISGTYTNEIPAGALTTSDGVSNAEPTRARVVVTSAPGLGKQFAPPVIPPSGVSRLTIVVDNDNTGNMTLTADLTDTLPTAPGAMVVATPNNLTTTCPGGVGVIAAAAGSPTVRLNSGAVIPPGGCRVEVDVTATLPGSYNNNIPAGGLQTDFGTNQQPANASLLVSTLGYISGKVFLDNLAPLDGVYAPGTDAPLNGVEIQLRSGATCSGTLLFTTHTDAQGNYLFAELPAGTYSVCQPAQPAGSLNSATRTGTIVGIGASTGTPGTASNPTATSSQIIGIVLGNDGGDNSRVSGSPNNDFSEVMPVSISGTVFMDGNNDGLQQGADPALTGVQIVLSGTDWLGNPVSQTTTTDASGQYGFTNLPPPGAGGYTVTEPAQPPASSNGITTAGPAVPNGTAGTATGTTTLPSSIAGIVLPPGTSSTGNNFAEIGNTRSVFGRVYRDLDDNGSFDGADTGIGGQTIQLTGTDASGNPVSLTATTLADGSFAFLDIPESNGAGYTLTQPGQPSNTASGFTTAGTTGGTGTPKATIPSQITGINLTGANMVSAENLFGEIDTTPLPPQPPPGGVVGIPTLSEWGMILLSSLMLLFGFARMRRRGTL